MFSRRRVVVAGLLVTVAAAGGVTRFVLSGDDRDPEKATALVRLGVSELTAGHIGPARTNFEKAIDADSHNRDAHYNLGYVFQVHDRKPAEAEVEYRRAIELDPAFDKALYSLAIVRARANDFDEAIALYRKAIAANPDFAEAHFNLGILLMDHVDKALGSREVAKGIQLKPELGAHLATTTTTRPRTTTTRKR
ncbi:MAG: hypothetical protein QOI61_1548 [Actinomycetota bacterium]|jgi:Tfp pilus assembly protein PilF